MIWFNGWMDFTRCLLVALFPGIGVGAVGAKNGFWYGVLAYYGTVVLVIGMILIYVAIWAKLQNLTHRAFYSRSPR
jgi:hypothetical protein